MKKFLTALTLTLAVFACCLIAACGEKTVDPVVIKTDDTAFEYSDKTLKDYMDYLQDDGKLTYTVSDGMVTEINGTSNTANSFWMLYTGDTENANDAWGTYEYQGETYGSAVSGAEALTVKENCVYIWVYQTF